MTPAADVTTDSAAEISSVEIAANAATIKKKKKHLLIAKFLMLKRRTQTQV
jgi:hypothetical protein